MEIGLEAVGGGSLPKDLYVSLRVGEAQKFMKANADRSYKFPASAVAERKYAKLEMYRRVGVCSLGIEPERMQGTHEIAVPIDEGVKDVKEVRYKVNVNSVGGAPRVPETPSADKGLDGRVASAKAYLDQHQLEQRLAEAMMAVLRERPEDPGKFIAEKLASGAGMLKKVADTKGPVYENFRKLPSVGTWIQAAPVAPASKPAAAASVASAPKPAESAAATAKPAAAPVVPPIPIKPLPVAAKAKPECDPIMPVSVMMSGGGMSLGMAGRPWMMIF